MQPCLTEFYLSNGSKNAQQGGEKAFKCAPLSLNEKQHSAFK